MNPEVIDRVLHETRHIRSAVFAVLVVLTLFLLASAVYVLKEYSFIGAGASITNTISVSGSGEVFAVPDIATFSLTVQEEAKEVADAQEVATKKMNDIIAYLKQQGIEDKDIKTTEYSVQPKYEWKQVTCRVGEVCPPGNSELTGFIVSQTLTVKVRDTKKAGELLSGAGGRGVSQVSGLSFTIDDEDALKAQARKLAIDEAQAKAEALANDLGVNIVRIVGFNENEGGYMPYMERSMVMDMAGGMGAAKAAAPEMPTGENKVSSNVSITYEIR